MNRNLLDRVEKAYDRLESLRQSDLPHQELIVTLVAIRARQGSIYGR